MSAVLNQLKPQILTLCMVERNEAHVLRRSLESFLKLRVLGFDLRYCISDGGSSDGSKELIREVLAEIPGEIFDHPQPDPIDDFSKYRNLNLDCAPADGYLLFLDADDEFEIRAGAMRGPLTEDAYFVALHSNGASWDRAALLKAGLPWRYNGEAHEAIPTSLDLPRVDWLRILVHAGEGARSRSGQKANLDYASLARKIADGLKNNPRELFYAAQSLRDAGRLDEALEAYAKRADMAEGWDEERYLSMLEIGRLLARRPEVGVLELQSAFLRAYSFRPFRAEAPGVLAYHMRVKGYPQQAIAFAMLAAGCPWPCADRLLVEEQWYTWRPFDEIAVAFAQTGNAPATINTYLDLLESYTLPDDQKARIMTNFRKAIQAGMAHK